MHAHARRAGFASRGWWSGFALLTLLLLGLGNALHTKHHLDDPDCAGDTPVGGAHACVCAGLHGGVIVAATTPAPSLDLVAAPASYESRAAGPRRIVRGPHAPRAPPLA